MSKQIRAVSLISGGLDSMLATKVIQEQGIEVEGLNFYTGFCVEGHTHAIRKHDKNKQKRNNALWVAETLGIKLHIIDVVEEYKDVVINPKYGYGQHLNPCLDCKVFMVKKALSWMEEHDFDFIITGEVIGQRPMSQRKATMPVIQKRSGAKDRLLRPLCAKNLPETYPELQGWVDREKLFSITGRSRKPQMGLAEKFKIEDYSQPAGGCCFLTNAAYASKLTDLWTARNSRKYELDDIILLKVGRHLRPRPHFKLIIGREEGENNYLEGYRHQFIHLRMPEHTGPLILVDGELKTEDDYVLAARIAARYTRADAWETIPVSFKDSSKDSAITYQVQAFTPDEISKEWYV